MEHSGSLPRTKGKKSFSPRPPPLVRPRPGLAGVDAARTLTLHFLFRRENWGHKMERKIGLSDSSVCFFDARGYRAKKVPPAFTRRASHVYENNGSGDDDDKKVFIYLSFFFLFSPPPRRSPLLQTSRQSREGRRRSCLPVRLK